MDPAAGTNVSLGTIGVSCTGALGAAIHAFSKSKPPGLVSLAAGINSGIVGLSFFGVREYLVSPVFVLSLDTPQYARRRIQFGITAPRFNDSRFAHEPGGNELRAIRRDRLLDSGISGAIAGGGLNYWMRGSRAIVPGGILIGLTCTLLQMAVNELAVWRIRFVAAIPTSAILPLTKSSTAPGSLPATSAPTLVATVHQPSEDKQTPKPTLQKIVETLSYVIPLTKVDDKEYLQRLEQKRDVLDQKIDRLSKEVSNESHSA